MKFDDLIINHLGEFGLYQKLQFFLVCLPTVFTAMHALSWTFTAAFVPHRCALKSEQSNSSYWLKTNSSFINVSSNCDENNQCYYEQCKYDGKEGCPYGYIFDRSEITYSAMDRWQIVCDRSLLKAVIMSMYYIGQMIGSLVFGILGDRIGRKEVFICALIMQIVAGLLLSVAPNEIFFGFLRIIVGSAHPGIFVIAVVIGMELAGPSKRKLASVMTGMFFSFGQVILGILAYFFRDYQYLQASIALPTIIFISYWWIVPESARWLISQKRFKEADLILQRVARINKTVLPSKWWEDEEICDKNDTTKSNAEQDFVKKNRKYNALDLFKTPKIRKISLAIFFSWPIVSMIYYGLSMNPTFLGGNLYVNFIFGGLMEIPAVLFVYCVVDKIGRKQLLIGGFVLASLCSLSNLMFDSSKSHVFVNLTQFLVAKCAITAVYATIYTFTPELFPTVIRNTAMGVCSMIARIGAILASYIALWLVDVLGKAAIIIPFSFLGLVAAIVIFVFLPETNGRKLYETIEELEGCTKFYELQPLQTVQQNFEKKLSSKDLN